MLEQNKVDDIINVPHASVRWMTKLLFVLVLWSSYCSFPIILPQVAIELLQWKSFMNLFYTLSFETIHQHGDSFFLILSAQSERNDEYSYLLKYAIGL